MKIEKTSAGKMAQLINAEIIGDTTSRISGLNEIHCVEEGDLIFVDHPKYYKNALLSKATAIIINQQVACPDGKVLLLHPEPFTAYNKLVRHFKPLKFSNQNISPTAKIGQDTVIMPGVFVGNHVSIGNNCIIYPNVVLYDDTQIGNNVVIHANSVLGSDAFYFKRRLDKLEKLESCGNVIVEDDVEIGASCTVDRGASGSTIIGKGTKIDNLVHIGHDSAIGKNCTIAAQVGVAGVVSIGDNVILWGQAGVANDVKISDNVEVYAQSGVGKDLESGKVYFGSPASEAREKFKELAYLKKLPSFIENIKNNT
ncbi:MAG: UDP-3-O-(3-hydroxymyristoyl)glucosamine N-acyltransferase [Bacteroidetes bacterium]|nr:UDP-3-O-(3-hydroxymyristoyl)glucosamine N-acyltransferase [Bacteroidota bacterium]